MIKKTVRDFFNGAAFGITQIIPGVSGGTIAIILGFYDELLSAVNHFREDYKKSLKFLCPLLLGAAAGILTLSSVITFLLANYSFPVMLFFIGLIMGVIPVIYSRVKEPGRKIGLRFKEIIFIAIPVLILIAISILKSAFSSDSPSASIADPAQNIGVVFMLFIFLAGILSAAALIIPGISGSFILLMFGIYPLVTDAISSIKDLFSDITNVALILNICKVLAPFAIGIIIGFFSMARLVEKLLKDYNKHIYLIILGLLLGSVYALFNDPILTQSGISPPVIIVGVLTLAAGAVISFILGKKRL